MSDDDIDPDTSALAYGAGQVLAKDFADYLEHRVTPVIEQVVAAGGDGDLIMRLVGAMWQVAGDKAAQGNAADWSTLEDEINERLQAVLAGQ